MTRPPHNIVMVRKAIQMVYRRLKPQQSALDSRNEQLIVELEKQQKTCKEPGDTNDIEVAARHIALAWAITASRHGRLSSMKEAKTFLDHVMPECRRDASLEIDRADGVWLSFSADCSQGR